MIRYYIGMLVLTLSGLAVSAECQPEGEYRKINQVGDSLEVLSADGQLTLRLSALGKILADGTRTSGAINGALAMSNEGCVAAYLKPEEDCSLFLMFSGSTIKVHQFGSCLFGAGAWAGGNYERSKALARNGLTRRSIRTPTGAGQLSR